MKDYSEHAPALALQRDGSRRGTNAAKRACVLAWVLGSLAACSMFSGEPDPLASPAPPRDWVKEIRAKVATAPSTVEVTPLLDPAVADLRGKAQAAERRRDFAAADAALSQAVGVRDDDPDLWQWRAEIALQQHRWRDAAKWAQRSLELGPRVGTLCVRNWLTLEAARTELKDAVSAQSARAQVQSCEVPALIRM